MKKCYWGHKWGWWKETERGNLQRTSDREIIGNYIVQERVCTRCNFKQVHKQTITIA